MKTTQKIRIVFLSVVCLLSVIGMIWALRHPRTVFIPPSLEENAVEGAPQEIPAELGYAALDVADYTVELCGSPEMKNDAAILYFTNPESNRVWLKVRICTTDGTILGESGLVMPDQYVKCVPLDIAPKADTPICIRIMGYEPETYRSVGAVTLNTVLKIA